MSFIVKLDRYSQSTCTGNGNYSKLYEICFKVHTEVEHNEFAKKNWGRIVLLTHGLFKHKDEVKTNAYWKMSEIFNKFGIQYRNIKHFDIACAPGNFIFAMQDYCSAKSIPYEFAGFTLKEGLELDSRLKDNKSIFYMNILTDTIPEKYKNNYNLVTGDIGTETSYAQLEELQLIELEDKQLSIALELISEGGTMILKMFTYSQKQSIRLADEFSKHFRDAYIFKPYSSRVLNNESYLVGIDYGSFGTGGKGTNAKKIEQFEFDRQLYRMRILLSAIEVIKLRDSQYRIAKDL